MTVASECPVAIASNTGPGSHAAQWLSQLRMLARRLLAPPPV